MKPEELKPGSIYRYATSWSGWMRFIALADNGGAVFQFVGYKRRVFQLPASDVLDLEEVPRKP